jgi:hypothetical protein
MSQPSIEVHPQTDGPLKQAGGPSGKVEHPNGRDARTIPKQHYRGMVQAAGRTCVS